MAAAVQRYYRVLDGLSQKPVRKPSKRLLTITRGEAFQMWQVTLVTDYDKGYRQLGAVKLLSIDQGAGSRHRSGRQQMQVDTCIDVSDVDVVDRNGRSIVAEGRPDRAASALVLELDKGVWYVNRDRDGKQKC